jgi:hypothetical protein
MHLPVTARGPTPVKLNASYKEKNMTENYIQNLPQAIHPSLPSMELGFIFQGLKIVVMPNWKQTLHFKLA